MCLIPNGQLCEILVCWLKEKSDDKTISLKKGVVFDAVFGTVSPFPTVMLLSHPWSGVYSCQDRIIKNNQNSSLVSSNVCYHHF